MELFLALLGLLAGGFAIFLIAIGAPARLWVPILLAVGAISIGVGVGGSGPDQWDDIRSR